MRTLICLLPMIALLSIASGAVAPEDEAVFSQAELDQMLAPIALYPDALLAQILTASTYPLEVVEAARWSKENRDLEGAAAVEAVDEREWDPSVKALVAFPSVLERMDEDLTWTRRLGDAVLMQEEEVMSSIQDLREKAYAAGSLESLENVTVRREREVIYIEPANPRIIYVPYYRPTVIYGVWGWPAYPPFYWGPPATVFYSSGGTRVFWTSGIHISSGFFYSRPDWHRRHIVVYHHHHHRHSTPPVVHHRSSSDWSRYSSTERWRHEPTHRRGVTYRSEALNERYGRSPASSGVARPAGERRSVRYAPNHLNREQGFQTTPRRVEDRADAIRRTSTSREGPRPDSNQARATTSTPRGTTAPVSRPRENARETALPNQSPSATRTHSIRSSQERIQGHAIDARREQRSSSSRSAAVRTEATPTAPSVHRASPRPSPEGRPALSRSQQTERPAQVREQGGSSNRSAQPSSDRRRETRSPTATTSSSNSAANSETRRSGGSVRGTDTHPGERRSR